MADQQEKRGRKRTADEAAEETTTAAAPAEDPSAPAPMATGDAPQAPIAPAAASTDAAAAADEQRAKKAARHVGIPWREVYYVGTEWYTLVQRDEQAAERAERHPAYFTLLEAAADGTPAKEWDFSNVGDALTAAQLKQPGARVYLWGQTEGVMDPETYSMSLMPVLCGLVTTAGAPTHVSITAREQQRLVTLAEIGARWVPLPDDATVLYLTSKYIREERAKLDAFTDEQLAEFQYANIYIEPERRQPDLTVEQIEADDDRNEVTVPYCSAEGGLMLRCDIRKDLETNVKSAMKENEIEDSQKDAVTEAIREATEGMLKEKAAEIARRKALTEAEKQVWRAAKVLKLYPANLPGRAAKFVNRHFGAADELLPEPKPVANAFGGFGAFGGGFGGFGAN